MKTILYFGSFDPVHNGHIGIARRVIDAGIADRFWFVVSPLNPLKSACPPVEGRHRLRMAEIALHDAGLEDRAAVCDIEFGLPMPSYTCDTLAAIAEKYPGQRFALLIGGDNAASFGRWKNHEQILDSVPVYVYRRSGDEGERDPDPRFIFLDDMPLIDGSSTVLRHALAHRDYAAARQMTDPAVVSYIIENKLY